MIRSDWAESWICDHVHAVCLGCATQDELATLEMDEGAVEAPSATGVYLLHYARPYANGRHPQHYLGWARNVRSRVERHANGTSRARLPEVLHAAGIRFVVARVWQDADTATERRLKRWNKARKLCPVCRRGQQLRLPLEERTAC
jgi:predicted GIY-YIG superfamily endonuclease